MATKFKDLLNILLLLKLVISSVTVNIDSSYSNDDLIMENKEYFVNGPITVKNLRISPCTKIIFNDFRSKIIVLNGKVDIEGNSSCPINVSQQPPKINSIFPKFSTSGKKFILIKIYTCTYIYCIFCTNVCFAGPILYLKGISNDFTLCYVNDLQRTSAKVFFRNRLNYQLK